MKVKLIHGEWKDTAILDISNKRLQRVSVENEYASFKIENNFLHIKWDKWPSETFISHHSDNIYYLLSEYEFVHDDWIDTCYLDFTNKIIYRKKTHIRGTFEIENDAINIDWTNSTTPYTTNHIKTSNQSENTIPNIIHFVFGLKEQHEEFELYRYLAIKSAYDVNKPDKIYFYYYHEPFGYWWNKIKPYLTLEKIIPPTEIYGNEVYHYAHQADIIRLEKLIERGGIYLDIDTICLKSFKDLLEYDFVMGTQTNSGETETYGLCNAVILSKPNAEFALRWHESYKTFKSKGRDIHWDEHSVIKPLELSRTHSKDIKILSSNDFFYPLWYDIHNILFNEDYDINEYKKIIKNNYCIHLWDTYSNSYLKKLTESIIFEKNTLYNIFARKFLKNSISLVFLTYNRIDITKKCLNSYLDILDKDDVEELIILDNNSNRDLIEYERVSGETS